MGREYSFFQGDQRNFWLLPRPSLGEIHGGTCSWEFLWTGADTCKSCMYWKEGWTVPLSLKIRQMFGFSLEENIHWVPPSLRPVSSGGLETRHEWRIFSSGPSLLEGYCAVCKDGCWVRKWCEAQAVNERGLPAGQSCWTIHWRQELACRAVTWYQTLQAQKWGEFWLNLQPGLLQTHRSAQCRSRAVSEGKVQGWARLQTHCRVSAGRRVEVQSLPLQAPAVLPGSASAAGFGGMGSSVLEAQQFIGHRPKSICSRTCARVLLGL